MNIKIFGAVLLLLYTAESRADTCDAMIAQAAALIVAPLKSTEDFSARLGELDGMLTQCPNHPWLNAIGAQSDLRAYELLVRANNGQPNQQALSFITRALQRSTIYFDAPSSQRPDKPQLRTEAGPANLTYSTASDSRQEILMILVDLAKRGVAHPYLALQQPLACTNRVANDAQTLSYALSTSHDRVAVAIPFIDAAAQACMQANTRDITLPFATQARAHLNLVRLKLLSDDEAIKQSLRKAAAAEQAYIVQPHYSLHWSDTDSAQLAKLLRQYDVGPWLSRSLWFTAEHIETAAAIEAIALYLNDQWSPLAAGTLQVESTLVAQAHSEFTKKVFALFNEGKEAGLNAQTKATLLAALKAFVDGEIRTFDTKKLPPPPEYILRILYATLAA